MLEEKPKEQISFSHCQWIYCGNQPVASDLFVTVNIGYKTRHVIPESEVTKYAIRGGDTVSKYILPQNF